MDAIGEHGADVLPRRPPGGEVVLQHPLAEGFGDDGPAVVDPDVVAQPRAVGVVGDRRDAVDHRVGERAVLPDPCREGATEALGRRQRGAAGSVAVARQVVATEDRERSGGAVAADGKRGGDAIERARRGRCRRLGVPGLGDREREDRGRRRGDEVGDVRVVAPGRRVHEADDRADHRHGRLTVSLFDQGVQMVLGAQRRRHVGVPLEEPEADDPRVAPGGRELVHVDGEMRPVEAADADVDDVRRHARPVVRRDGDAATPELGEVGLVERSGGPSHIPI
jgi:hypothetical protein